MFALVIDDSRAVRRIIGEMLKELDFEVVEAENGRRALEQLEAYGCPDIILVDWNMPEMNGFDFLVTARAIEEYENVPIMMVTTETEMERMAQAFVAGANEYVMKPFDKATIHEKLQLLGVGA